MSGTRISPTCQKALGCDLWEGAAACILLGGNDKNYFGWQTDNETYRFTNILRFTDCFQTRLENKNIPPGRIRAVVIKYRVSFS